MNLRHNLGKIRRQVLCTFYRRPVLLGNSGPIVSFSFDDFPRTAYSVGGAILEKFSARGTYYVTPGLMNISNKLGDLCVNSDLQCLAERGHELGTQTFHHSSCRSVSFARFQQDVQEGIAAIERLTGFRPTNFAYPYGHVTLRTKKKLGPGLSSSRSVVPGVNGPEIDLNLLRANPLYGDVDSSKQVEELIERNREQKSWLIFYTHDIRSGHSEYGCTPALFEFAVSLAARRGGRILTIQAALAEVGTAPQATSEIESYCGS